MEWGRFFRDRFDLLFVTGLFIFLYVSWSQSHNPDLKDFVVGMFGALLATVNASLKLKSNPSIQAENIETANVSGQPGQNNTQGE